jgi:hypothetical protein
MAYFAGIENRKDRDLNRAIPGLKDVLRSLADPMPFGVAFPLGPNGAGRPLWRLNIDGTWVVGRFVIIGREFRPAQ